MENQKSSGFFGKLFQGKKSDCCSVQIEEIPENEVGARHEANRSEKVAADQETKPVDTVDRPAKGCCQ